MEVTRFAAPNFHGGSSTLQCSTYTSSVGGSWPLGVGGSTCTVWLVEVSFDFYGGSCWWKFAWLVEVTMPADFHGGS